MDVPLASGTNGAEGSYRPSSNRPGAGAAAAGPIARGGEEAQVKPGRRCCESCWGCPARLAKRYCPFVVQTLRQFGYDQLLVITSSLHIFLWLSCFISLGFVAVWFSDVTTVNCANAQIGRETHMPLMHCAYCASEAIGILVFFGSFADSIRMIAHLDNDKQQLLKRREEQLNKLAKESERALVAAARHIEGLRRDVIADMKSAFANFLVEIFNIILPRLMQSIAPKQRQKIMSGKSKLQDLTPIREFTDQIREILEEPGEFTQEFLREFQEEHPELAESKEFNERMEEAVDAFKRALDDWDDWLCTTCPGIMEDSSAQQGGRPWFPGRSLSLRGSLANPFQQEQMVRPPVEEARHLTVDQVKARAQDIVDGAFELLNATLDIPKILDEDKKALFSTDFERRSDGSFAHMSNMDVTEPSATSKFKRFGWGKPPDMPRGVPAWPKRFCLCCMPRVAAVACSCAICCCIDPEQGEDRCIVQTIKNGFRYKPPKRFRLGCFWVEVRTKLQERLLQGILFSVLYLAIYAYFFWLMIDGAFDPTGQSGSPPGAQCTKPNWWNDPTAWKDCTLQVARKGVAILCLLTHIPCVCTCLYHVDRLDAVEETIQVTWKLKGIKEMVDAFNHRMDQGEQNTYLLQCITQRTGFRKKWVNDFGLEMSMLHDIGVTEATARVQHITRRLLDASETLGRARDFLELSNSEQKERVESAERIGEDAPSPVIPRESEPDHAAAAGVRFEDSMVEMPTKEAPLGSFTAAEDVPSGTFVNSTFRSSGAHTPPNTTFVA